MAKYASATYKLSELVDGVMTIPTYQRPLVWSETQKINFIENVSKGYPFGSLLLYRFEPGEPFTLIDGQQRFTTLRDYESNPEKYFRRI